MSFSISNTRPSQWKYLRVLHNYTVPLGKIVEGEQFDSSEILCLHEGDLILVYLIHDNGWADGTVLNSRERGWFPANYCDEYKHEHSKPFFDAVADIWSTVTGDSSLRFTAKDQVDSLTVGARHMLVSILHITMPPDH